MAPIFLVLEPPSANLALAVIASSEAPLVLLDGDLKVIAASASFWQTFAIAPEDNIGRHISALGTGEWRSPQLASLLHAVISGFAKTDSYEMDIFQAGFDKRSVVVNAARLNYADAKEVRLLVTISDVTAARRIERLKDDLLRDKSILLQELQHRVANSLQIIASVLMQSARRVQSEETRTHLYDAHHRVMSIATLQQQLATSSLEDVELRPYLTTLCSSLGASMILDTDRIRLFVSVDQSTTTADASVSLGLIVTELVINALKHAFPDLRSGTIAVDYHSRGSQWTLSVADNGVGTAKGPEPVKPGLGTAIVEALARKMLARVEIVDADPGTAVSIVHAAAADAGSTNVLYEPKGFNGDSAQGHADMEFNKSGWEKRFAVFDARGLVAIKADLASTDRSAIGGPAAVSLAWEWVVMKESAASETGNTVSSAVAWGRPPTEEPGLRRSIGRRRGGAFGASESRS